MPSDWNATSLSIWASKLWLLTLKNLKHPSLNDNTKHTRGWYRILPDFGPKKSLRMGTSAIHSGVGWYCPRTITKFLQLKVSASEWLLRPLQVTSNTWLPLSVPSKVGVNELWTFRHMIHWSTYLADLLQNMVHKMCECMDLKVRVIWLRMVHQKLCFAAALCRLF